MACKGIVVLLGLFVAPSCGVAASGASSKIYNGREAKPNSHPWLVWLVGTYDHFDGLVCSGALVHERYILTAAHCTNASYGTYMAISGDHDRLDSPGTNFRPVKGSIVHPDYNSTSGSYDLALVELIAPMQLIEGTVELATISTNELFLKRVYRGGRKCKFAGWGSSEERVEGSVLLQEITIKAVADDECKAEGYNIVEPNFCWKAKKGKRAPCGGDDGGPLVCRNRGTWEMVGIHVFNPPKDDCTEGIKGAAKLTPVLSWLEEYIL